MADMTINDLIARLQEIARDYGGHLPVCLMMKADERARLRAKSDVGEGYIVSYVGAFVCTEETDDMLPSLLLISTEAAQDFPHLQRDQPGHDREDENEDC